MIKSTASIVLDINNVDVTAEVSFRFYEKQKSVVDGNPDFRMPGEDAYFEIYSISIANEQVNGLLSYSHIVDCIIDQLTDLRECHED